MLNEEIGRWNNKSIIELFNFLFNGNGQDILATLISNGKLEKATKINNLETKVHSNLGPEHIQITLTDDTELNRLRDLEQRTKIIDSFFIVGLS